MMPPNGMPPGGQQPPMTMGPPGGQQPGGPISPPPMGGGMPPQGQQPAPGGPPGVPGGGAPQAPPEIQQMQMQQMMADAIRQQPPAQPAVPTGSERLSVR